MKAFQVNKHTSNFFFKKAKLSLKIVIKNFWNIFETFEVPNTFLFLKYRWIVFKNRS